MSRRAESFSPSVRMGSFPSSSPEVSRRENMGVLLRRGVDASCTQAAFVHRRYCDTSSIWSKGKSTRTELGPRRGVARVSSSHFQGQRAQPFAQRRRVKRFDLVAETEDPAEHLIDAVERHPQLGPAVFKGFETLCLVPEMLLDLRAHER